MPVPRIGRGSYLKTLREAAFAQGLCYECAGRPVVFGRRRCDPCNEKNRARLAAKFEAGQCRGLCGKQRPADRARCDDCRARHREYMRQRRIAAGKTPRPPRVKATVSPTSVAPPVFLRAPVDGQRKGDSARPAEVGPLIDRATRLRMIATRVESTNAP